MRAIGSCGAVILSSDSNPCDLPETGDGIVRSLGHYSGDDGATVAIGRCDLRADPLIERKAELARIVPAASACVLAATNVAERGVDLFRLVCERDLEGIVAKWRRGPYVDGSASGGRAASTWYKIRNVNYSQQEGRRELFEKRFAAGR